MVGTGRNTIRWHEAAQSVSNSAQTKGPYYSLILSSPSPFYRWLTITINHNPGIYVGAEYGVRDGKPMSALDLHLLNLLLVL